MIMINKARMIKQSMTILLALFLAFSFTACGGQNAENPEESTQQSVSDEESSSGEVETDTTQSASNEESSVGEMETETAQSAPTDTETTTMSETNTKAQASSGGKEPETAGENHTDPFSDSRILIAYFSHTGENYEVGVIEKGNTRIIADMIAEETGADMFEIRTVNPYPDIYEECTDVAKKEQNESARPEILDPPENLDEYDTIFIGYPIWWGDLPMAVYTFLENYDFSGKTVIPFCTHAGSGLSGTQSRIEDTCSGATVLDGLSIRGSTAQNQQEKAKEEVLAWLDELEMSE